MPKEYQKPAVVIDEPKAAVAPVEETALALPDSPAPSDAPQVVEVIDEPKRSFEDAANFHGLQKMERAVLSHILRPEPGMKFTDSEFQSAIARSRGVSVS